MNPARALPKISREDTLLRMPGLATAHSHAFQRALRGRTQRQSTEASSFWSWRGLMYHLVERLDPQTVHAISRFAFVELAMSGVTAVGEFHYLHHDRDGQPYADRLEMAAAVVEAARSAGIRITLIRTAYLRGGHDQDLSAAQCRFADPDIDTILGDVDALCDRYGDDPSVGVAIAAHSIRAVPIAHISELAQFAADRGLPLHMHVAEQRRELDECQAEYGTTPVALLAEHGVLSESFVAVHATHLTTDEIELLGRNRSSVCLCRTTERDLGDGSPPTAELVSSGVGLCVGVDSHCGADAFEEVRAVELDDRSRIERRLVALSAPQLLEVGSRRGYAAIGLPSVAAEDEVWLDATDPSLAGCDEDLLEDAVIFGATPRCVKQVVVAGRTVVEDGRHVDYDEALTGYEAALRRLLD